MTFAGVLDDGRGRCVELDLGDSTKIVFGRLNEIRVKEGERLKRGAIVGALGSAGRGATAHLHLEYWQKGEAFDPTTVKNLIF